MTNCIKKFFWQAFIRCLPRRTKARPALASHRHLALCCCLWLLAWPAHSELLVKKQRFDLASFTTQSGVTLPVSVGWEAYGTLNQDKSNVVLVTHYFSGTSHAAGKYAATDAQAGYWDAIIGPGKAIDTNKYFVISSDTLVNLNVKDPQVITTGPASINPKTGKPYGLDFPVVTITDFVEVQKALLDSLGIQKLHAVIGPSMGSFQALEWASRYPEKVERVAAVIGTGYMDAWTAVRLERWAYPIKADPHWQQGNYYDKPQQPKAGLAVALAYVTQDALHPSGFNQKYPDLTQDVGAHHDIRQSFTVWDQLLAAATNRSQLMDANSLLYLVRASQLWRAGMGEHWQASLQRIRAKTLILPAAGDGLLTPAMAAQTAAIIQASNPQVTQQSIALPATGSMGHLDGLLHIQDAAPAIKAWLEH